MTNVFIFHGTGGHPLENWFPWLKAELEQRECTVTVPQFPNAGHPTPETWYPELEKYKADIGPDSILIGHSLGGAILLRLLEMLDVRVKAVFIVAAPIGVLPIKYYETDKPFIENSFDWKKIKNSSKYFCVIHSPDDPLVSFGNGEKIARETDAEFISIPHAGHFNTSAGYTEFPLLLERILSRIEA